MSIPIQGALTLVKRPRFIIVSLVLALVILGGFWMRGGGTNTATLTEGLSPKANENLIEQIKENIKDTDHDGLQDWEEEIIGTDSSQADTDEDGTNDGAEITAQRDPLKKGPNDASSLDTPTPSLTRDGEKNLTFALANSLLESGVLSAIGEDGRITSLDFLDRLAFPQDINPDLLFADADPVTREDLTIVTTTDADRIRAYFAAVTEIYDRHINRIPRSDIEIFSLALETKNYELLDSLEPIARAAEATVGDLQSLPVPSQYTERALADIRYLREVERAAKLFGNVQEDPVAAMIALRRRLTAIIKMVEEKSTLITELRQTGIIENS
jgi:hypothetical protein